MHDPDLKTLTSTLAALSTQNTHLSTALKRAKDVRFFSLAYSRPGPHHQESAVEGCRWRGWWGGGDGEDEEGSGEDEDGCGGDQGVCEKRAEAHSVGLV